MHWIDWSIAILPVVFILGVAIYSRKYVRGVVDYLAAGRVAGRYVIAVGDLQAGLSVITLVALVEAKYQTGFALAFWENLLAPVGVVVALTGYCVYRFRETKALSIGQFLEMRYNRPFRIVAASIRTLAEMMTNAIGPAVAVNFFIYFLGLPHHIELLGMSIPTFVVLLTLLLAMALTVIWPAGRISLLITDCVQGLLSYPIFVIIVGYILLNFSWGHEIAPVMLDRADGESFLNPFDIDKLRDFNIFALVVNIIGNVLNRASWIGNDTTNAGRTPHEQKMAGILGAWRNGFSLMMCTLVAITVITVMTHGHFADRAREIRTDLSNKVAAETIASPEKREILRQKLEAIPPFTHEIGKSAPVSRLDNPDIPYMEAVGATVGTDGEGNLELQKFRSLYNQMMMPIAFHKMLPVGLMGLFCLLMVMLLLSTDDMRIFNASSTIIQDVVLPFRKTAFTPTQHIFWLKICSVMVAVFFFVCSLFFVQLDYINMFVTIMGAVWLGGAGPVMIFGLYSRFGNTTGAFSALGFGTGVSVGGLLLQRNWADHVYPFLVHMGWRDGVADFLAWCSQPFNPYVVWAMDPVKFPINSMEIYFIAMVGGVVAYVAGSLLTYRGPYNLDRLLHRGIYDIDGDRPIHSAWTLRNLFGKLIGITPEYTRGDKVIAWSVFLYTFVFQVGICFVGVLIWNAISPLSDEWWSGYFLWTTLIIAGVIGVISTVWFMWGGLIDSFRLFRDLAARMDDPLDDGRVEGEVSLMDKAAFEAAAGHRRETDAGKQP